MKRVLGSIVAATMLSAVSYADELSELKAKVAQLEEKTNALVDETSDLKTGFSYTTVDETKRYSGLGAAASKVYYSNEPLSIGGYGEMYYAANSDGSSVVDVYRFIPYIGYKFSDNIILNTEIEFEHGGVKASGAGGEVIVEFMYLDFLINSSANIRVGNMLVPMGFINESHEPTLFTTVQRPKTAKYLLPTTWHENGAMVYGNLLNDNLSYKVALVTALKTGADGSSWLRDGRGGSFKQNNPNAATVARLDYIGLGGLTTGASIYYGNAADGTSSYLTMYDLHLDYANNGVRFYGVYTANRRTNSGEVAANATKSSEGGYANLSYNILALTQSSKKAPLFVQYERYTTAKEAVNIEGVATPYTTNYTIGANYFPHDQVVLKADVVQSQNDGSDVKNYTTSVSMGFIF